MRSTDLGRAAARAVPCPHCCAAIGADCAQDGTAELCGLHVARLLLAERERSERPAEPEPHPVWLTWRAVATLVALGALLAWWAGRER